MNHSSSVGACDTCGKVGPLVENDFCEDCAKNAKRFEALVDKVEAYAVSLQAEGYSTSEVLGALESAGDILRAQRSS